jgi:predicted metal-binding membrane protein
MRIEGVLRRDRLVVGAGLGLIAGFSWAYTLWLAVGMAIGQMPTVMAMPLPGAWTAVDLGLMFVMWVVMMAAMMTPSVAPTVLLMASIERRRDPRTAAQRSGLFFFGYLAVWGGFSLAATLVQWALHDTALLRGAMGNVVPALAGGILIVAGLYQLAPLKAACLSHCRSPVEALAHGWRPGPLGAWRMGLEHGVYCLGCCWALMAVLFAAGIMNPLWIGLLSIAVLVEKLAPRGDWIGRLLGIAMMAWGGWVAVGA